MVRLDWWIRCIKWLLKKHFVMSALKCLYWNPSIISNIISSTRKGLLGFDTMNIAPYTIHYWAGIAEALRAIGCTVIITRVPRTADVSVRASVLHATLKASDIVRNAGNINVLAHSMVCHYFLISFPNVPWLHLLVVLCHEVSAHEQALFFLQ